MSTDDFENLTDVELAREIYLGIVALDDELTDSQMARLPHREASALWARLRGPYCEVEGCPNEHMASFPWCPWHRPASYGPLPPDFPPNPHVTTEETP